MDWAKPAEGAAAARAGAGAAARTRGVVNRPRASRAGARIRSLRMAGMVAEMGARMQGVAPRAPGKARPRPDSRALPRLSGAGGWFRSGR